MSVLPHGDQEKNMNYGYEGGEQREQLIGKFDGAFKMSNVDEGLMVDGRFNYVKKNNYEGYNETLASIPDDPSGLDGILADLKTSFKTHQTRDIDFRIQQLRALQQGLTDMADELTAAVEKDLGRGAFYAHLAEVHGTKVEI